MNKLQSLYVRSGLAVTALAVGVPKAFAEIFGTTSDVLTDAPDATSTDDVRRTVINLLNQVLNLLALVAVVVIVIAGIRLIVSQGEEEAKDKAKKTIIYVVAGLIVILLAKVIVNFATSVILDAAS